MQLDYLKYLIAIKEYGSMNKAAEHLYMSQQNISKAVKRLEEEFGYKIFTGSARKQVFTEEGERLYQYAFIQGWHGDDTHLLGHHCPGGQ